MTPPLVVKVGGGADVDLEAVVHDLAALHEAGHQVILVHGGNAELNTLSSKLGNPPKFVTSPSGHQSRFTDRETLEQFMMAYCGKVNTLLVEQLQAAGVNALGLSGVDGRLLQGRFKGTVRSVEEGRVRILRGDNTGTVEQVNSALLASLMAAGYLPVISPPAVSYCGRAMNVDGDRAAAAVAVAMRASELILLSNVPGLLSELSDEDSLVQRVDVSAPEPALALAQGRMKPKLLGALTAVAGGVSRVVLADARVQHPISAAISGQGTVVA